MTFQDHFSRQARLYAQHRPGYPAEFFDFLASLTPTHEFAWDCGTGSGQAARALAGRFDRVVATDASADQLAQAIPHERVEYRLEPAESTTIPDQSLDLIAVGTAAHWFEFESFYREVRRVGKPSGIIALWTYHLPTITHPVDEWTEHFFRTTLAPYWPERVRYVDERYRTLPFPFEEIPFPAFAMEADWEIDSLVGFFASWSGTRAFCDAEGEEKFAHQIEGLKEAWGDTSSRRTVRWSLHGRIGRLLSLPARR